MQIRNIIFKGRRGWELDNDTLQLVILQGGGHLASLIVKNGLRVNPFWEPIWKGIDPWGYRKRDTKRFGNKMLATIAGHNVCVGWFGSASPEEERQGLGAHGEATVARWRVIRKSVTRTGLSLVIECDLPVFLMRLRRTIRMAKGQTRVAVREVLINRSRRDQPFTLCEHVTFGPPFLKKGVTRFDMSATRGHTYPGYFDKPPRLKSDTAFTWPMGPGVDGKLVDLRVMDRARKRNADFSTQLMDPAEEKAWFSACNPELGLMVTYRWKRDDFPWVGNWEENFAKTYPPWEGKTLTRGMEFTNTPFPDGFRKALERGKMHGVPTYRWISARGRVTMGFEIMIKQDGQA
ncbi:MAG: hypothetical protein WCS52_15935 [bacterium]